MSRDEDFRLLFNQIHRDIGEESDFNESKVINLFANEELLRLFFEKGYKCGLDEKDKEKL